jgi:hypothetical protein
VQVSINALLMCVGGAIIGLRPARQQKRREQQTDSLMTKVTSTIGSSVITLSDQKTDTHTHTHTRPERSKAWPGAIL